MQYISGRLNFHFLIFFAITSCVSRPPLESGSKFAHFQTDSIYGSPLSLMNYHQSNIYQPASFEICVQSNVASIPKKAFLFETKLAFSAWWKYSGFSSKSWDLLNFKEAPECNSQDTSLTSFVSIPNPDSKTPDQKELSGRFPTPQITCEIKIDKSYSCSDNGILLGLGRVATVSFRYNPKDFHVETISIAQPAISTFSPHVDWQGLDEAIKRSKVMNSKLKASLISKYNSLISSEKLSFESLVVFYESLETNKLIDENDQSTLIEKVTEMVASQKIGKVVEPYRPRKPLFTTMLHEIGHQLGMDHSDNPQPTSVTGTAEKGIDSPNSPPTLVKEAVMAYGLPYFYLTEDDIAGIKSVVKSLPK